MMTFPNEWKNKISAPNHQPDHQSLMNAMMRQHPT
jgi:hypothetical protein